MLIVGLRLDPVRVSKQLGHTNSSFTQDTYAHLFEKARHADELRAQLGEGFGHLLDDVNGVSTGARNGAQVTPAKLAAVAPMYG